MFLKIATYARDVRALIISYSISFYRFQSLLNLFSTNANSISDMMVAENMILLTDAAAMRLVRKSWSYSIRKVAFIVAIL